MKEYVATISRRGQITLPAEVRRVLGVESGDKITFSIDGSQIIVRLVEFTIESAFSSVRPLRKDVDIEEAIHTAKEERPERMMERISSPQKLSTQTWQIFSNY